MKSSARRPSASRASSHSPGKLAPLVGADVAKTERAAQLCKADLLTDVVGEFPELQGLMGRYYAEAQDEDEAVAHACEDHYKPKGPDDLVPSGSGVNRGRDRRQDRHAYGLWKVDEKPTGSKDPYALRRAALGVIRIVLDNSLRLRLAKISSVPADLLSFFADRLKVQLREAGRTARSCGRGIRARGQDDLLMSRAAGSRRSANS